MRAIQKGREPQSLIQHRRSPHADYDNYRQKDELRVSLAIEQGGICCYCMQRIRPEVGGMKIEHWHCQTLYPDEQLSYNNLLGACMGSEGQPRSRQHCDTRKGDSTLSRNPANPDHRIEDRVRYPGDGRIESSDASDAQFDRELNEILNLNVAFLVNNRKAILDSFTKGFASGTLGRSALQRMIREWSTADNGELRPFCGIVIYWLKKRLARI